MILINISTLQIHYLSPFYSLNPLEISLKRPKKLKRTLHKEHIMDTCKKLAKILKLRDFNVELQKSLGRPLIYLFLSVWMSVSLSKKRQNITKPHTFLSTHTRSLLLDFSRSCLYSFGPAALFMGL